jgi:prepilin-type processing-associated H-X9-DG protein
VLAQAQALLKGGQSKNEVAQALHIKQNTFDKAIRDGRLMLPVSIEKVTSTSGSVKTERSEADSRAKLGMGCLRVLDRIAASRGELDEAAVKFEPGYDVSNGGVLCALPALLANGLLNRLEEFFSLPKGFYSLVQIVLLLGFLALARIKSFEQVRYTAPGEWGKILGLDRIPEVRILREKVKRLAQEGEVHQWQVALSQEWMANEPKSAGILYVDGHVRTYFGSQTKLPRRYVARQRLCLRGMTDYWVNDRLGRPFFVVTSPFTPGLLKMLKTEITPRLLSDIPDQPSSEALKENPYLHRFVQIFDREGYSPAYFKQMWQEHRIACQTYHKYPGEDWSADEFTNYLVDMAWGNRINMKLAERGTRLKNGFWVREIRRLTDSGHQTAVISTDYLSESTLIAAHMFGRWSQENFFKYMMHHFEIDKLISYQTEAVDETKKVVNPAWRELNSVIRSKTAKLSRKKVEFADVNLAEGLSDAEMAEFEVKKSTLQEEISWQQTELDELKEKRKNTDKHLRLDKLPQSERFRQFSPLRKQFVDTIKMIAYRAETAMALELRDVLARPDEVRSLLRQIYLSDADLIPDEKNGVLTVRLHHLTNHFSDEAVQYLFIGLNETETIYPGTNLKMKFELGIHGATDKSLG